jgi:hypothetical protein
LIIFSFEDSFFYDEQSGIGGVDPFSRATSARVIDVPIQKLNIGSIVIAFGRQMRSGEEGDDPVAPIPSHPRPPKNTHGLDMLAPDRPAYALGGSQRH